MDQLNSTTQHIKGKHLSFEERVIIQTRRKDGHSIRSIARDIGCAANTVRNELIRGTVDLYNGHVQRYKATKGQEVYEAHRLACGRHYDLLLKERFIAYVVKHFYEDKWSLDVCYGRALESGEFTRDEIVCCKTLYNYVEYQLIAIHHYYFLP